MKRFLGEAPAGKLVTVPQPAAPPEQPAPLPVMLPPEAEEVQRAEAEEVQAVEAQKPVVNKPLCSIVDPPLSDENQLATEARLTKAGKPDKRFKADKKERPVWEPTEEEFATVRQLAALGWPVNKLHEALDIKPHAFAAAVIYFPRLTEEFNAGVEECEAAPEKMLSWRPLPKHIALTYEHAKAGLGPIEIAAKLKVGRQAVCGQLLLHPWSIKIDP
jgi:hypothetical protein